MEQKQSTFQNTGGKKMGKALIIGCGGVASVAIAKCCQNSDVFTEVYDRKHEQNPNVML